ncbi:tau-tubulin kinase 1 [Anaeramoeba ignava]|uniref:Tau-tubulin kinase 1 n=1 Tax=Anaeramoeba ignava TaxID=1746090 RepID=A0A9Q0LUV2_ANAIG|nr:tau-tubulin kinase 1 [Anaeramoeba ignava]
MQAFSHPLNGRWLFTQKIGQGSFGQIFMAYDNVLNQNVAIKLEKRDQKRPSLKLEVSILKRLQGTPYAVELISSGKNSHYNFLIMELLGKSLDHLVKNQENHTFSLSTTIRLGIQMISSIESIHKIGFIHRDIKPSNFALRRKENITGNKEMCCIIDFGLSRKYIKENGELRAPRLYAGFRGTARYASINAHQREELSRRDDLISLYYVLIEFLTGKLPWSGLKDKDEITKLKIKYNTPDLCQNLPEEFSYFFVHLQSLKFHDKPNYKYLRKLLTDLAIKLQYQETMSFDWELKVYDPNISDRENKKSNNTKEKGTAEIDADLRINIESESEDGSQEISKSKRTKSNINGNSIVHQNHSIPDLQVEPKSSSSSSSKKKCFFCCCGKN